MYKVSAFSDGKSDNGFYRKNFQGKLMTNCMDLTYWYRWGEWVFDIREIRQLYNRKKINASDDKNEQERFTRVFSEIKNLVGTESFLEVLKKAALQSDLKEGLI